MESTMPMTVEKVLYTGKAHTTGGRDGASRSARIWPDKRKSTWPAL